MPGRRQLLAAISAAPLAAATTAAAHAPFGRVLPVRPAPAVPLTLHDRSVRALPALLAGQVTALQLMFTGCTATCPVQGALFAEIARRLPAAGQQVLSMSIDPLSDTPTALALWLSRHGAPARWRAAVPTVAGVDAVLDALQGRASGPDSHTAQVYLFDAQARLVYRTAAFPTPTHVLDAMGAIAAGSASRRAATP